MKKNLLNKLILISGIGMTIFGMLLLSIWYKDKKALDYWKTIATLKETAGDWSKQGILPVYQSLYDKNHDMVGWIDIDGGRISYPVMHTKTEPEYYLRRNFDKEADTGGTPFVDYRCDVIPYQSFNTIIYGHYTDGDRLFRRLLDYAYKVSYEKNRYIQFDTLLEENTYEIVAAFYVDASDVRIMSEWDANAEDAYTFYNYIEIDSKEGFEKFKENIESQKLYETEAEITMDSHIITIICCAPKTFSGIEENGRCVVIAVKQEK